MKPLALHGHERAITQIKYNRDGDLLFSASKDVSPNVWYSINGERLGTFDGHTGAVWCLDCNWDTTKVATGAADNTCRIGDCSTGKELNRIVTNTAVRTVTFSYSGKSLLYSTDSTMNMAPEVHIIDLNDPEHIKSKDSIVTIKDIHNTKPTSALFGPLDETFITGHDNGVIAKWEARMPKTKVIEVVEHRACINDLQFNKDQSMFISASKDNTSKLFDTATLKHLKTYKTERNVNSAAISPTNDHVVVGGGQEAMDVTTTSTRSGKFEARFFHMIFEDEFARVKGHFGPINSVAFHPDGKSYSSGGEDGYVRINSFDPSYFDFKFEC